MRLSPVLRKAAITALAFTVGGIIATGPAANASTTRHLSMNAHNTAVRVVSGHSGLIRESRATYEAKAAAAGIEITTMKVRDATALSTSCWYYNDWRSASNIFGSTLWKFNVEPNWCGSGGWITSAYNDTWANVNFPGWAYKGLTQSTDRYGVGWNVYENVRQGHFCLAEYFDCVQNSYPYVDVEVGAGGQVYKS